MLWLATVINSSIPRHYMARGRAVVLALLLVVSMMLAGCLSPEIQEWGSEGIEVSIDNDAMTATMSTHTGDLNVENDVVNLLGCDGNGNFSAAVNETSTDKPVNVEGWLHLSKHFPEGAIGGESMSASAVIIELGKYEDAQGPTEGKVDGVGSSWSSPTVGVKARPPGFDSSNDFPQKGWAVVGLVPANEEILEGFAALDWHQPIALEGWLMDGSYMGYSEIHMSNDGDCRIYAGANREGFRGTLLVTSMTLGDHGLIDKENSYNAFSVPVVGSWIYSLLILISFGASFLLFVATNGLIRRGAKISASELLTEAQMIAARGVKSEYKKAVREIEEETGEKVKVRDTESRKPQLEKRPEGESVELDDFDIDSAIHGAHRPSARSVTSASSGGVVETVEAIEMQDKLDEFDATQELEKAANERPKGVYVSSSPIIPTDESSENLSEKETKSARKVRKTKTVKKEEDKTSPPIKSGPDIADDDDFSDFSFD